MLNNYLKNISMLSGVKTSTLKKLYRYELKNIKNEIQLNGTQKIYTFETQYGTFQVNAEDSKNLKFHFTPNPQLKKAIVSGINNKPVDMDEDLNDLLSEELFTFYSNLF